MTDWTITATTIFCDAVDDEVTLMIDKDGVAKCTGYNRYFKDTARSLKARSQRSGRQLRCEGLECHRVTQYKDNLFAGEAGLSQGHQP